MTSTARKTAQKPVEDVWVLAPEGIYAESLELQVTNNVSAISFKSIDYNVLGLNSHQSAEVLAQIDQSNQKPKAVMLFYPGAYLMDAGYGKETVIGFCQELANRGIKALVGDIEASVAAGFVTNNMPHYTPAFSDLQTEIQTRLAAAGATSFDPNETEKALDALNSALNAKAEPAPSTAVAPSPDRPLAGKTILCWGNKQATQFARVGIEELGGEFVQFGSVQIATHAPVFIEQDAIEILKRIKAGEKVDAVAIVMPGVDCEENGVEILAAFIENLKEKNIAVVVLNGLADSTHSLQAVGAEVLSVGEGISKIAEVLAGIFTPQLGPKLGS